MEAERSGRSFWKYDDDDDGDYHDDDDDGDADDDGHGHDDDAPHHAEVQVGLTLRTMKRRTLKREPKQVKNSLKMATIKKRGRRRIKRGKRRITTWETTRIKVSASFFGPSQSPLLPPSPKYVKFTIYKVP